MNSSDSVSKDIIQSVVTHYRNNVLFGIFLYPYIRADTLMKLTLDGDIGILPCLLSYLRNICTSIYDSLKKLKASEQTTTTDDYLTQQIFFWNKDTAESLPWISILFLKYFLEKTLKWDWLDAANFIPHIQERTIEIRNPHNLRDNSTIRILKDGKTAILRQNSKRMFEFRISETDAMISFEIKTPLKRINTVNNQFLEKSKKHLLILISELREQAQFSQLLGTFEFFYNDERFRNALIRMDLKPLTKIDYMLDH